MIQIDRETFQMMLQKIMERFDRIDDRLNRMNRQTAALEGDKLLDNQDMCELLGVTKRTLARYRQKKLVTYYMIDGRTYYKASEVQDFLNRKGKVLPARIKKEKQTFDELVVRLSMIEKKVTGICSQTKDAALKKWMDNQEVCGILRISKRTLQVYREKGLLPFTRIKNKFFYKPEDVQSLLESSYHPQKRKP